MGLLDRYKEHLAEQARERAAEAEAHFKAVQETEPFRLQALADEQQRLAEGQKIRAAIIAELSPLLKIIGAREQLEDARKIWNAGKIDKIPYLSGSELGLDLRVPYWFTSDLHLPAYNNSHNSCMNDVCRVCSEQRTPVTKVIQAEERLAIEVDKTPMFRVSLTYMEKEASGHIQLNRAVYRGDSRSIDVVNPPKSKADLVEIMFQIINSSPTPQILRAYGKRLIGSRPIPHTSFSDWAKGFFE